MKKQSTILFFVLAAALLLSACGTLPANSWPGITAPADVAYLANGPYVYAVKMTDGTELWRYPTKAEGTRQFFAAPALSGEMLIAGDYNGILVAINIKNGQEMWRYTAKNKFIASPVIVNDVILASCGDGFIYAVDLTGVEKWKYETTQPIWSDAVSDGQNVFVAGLDHNLVALDLQNGAKKWTLDMGAAAIYAPSLGDDGKIYVATLANEILAIRSTDGTIAWKKDMPNHLWAKPKLVDGNLYFGDMTGKIFSLSAADGTQLWELQVGDTTSGGVVGEATALENGLAFATQNGKIFKVGTNQERLGTISIEGKLYSGPVYVTGTTPKLLIGVVGGEAPLVAVDLNGTELWSFVPAK